MTSNPDVAGPRAAACLLLCRCADDSLGPPVGQGLNERRSEARVPRAQAPCELSGETPRSLPETLAIKLFGLDAYARILRGTFAIDVLLVPRILPETFAIEVVGPAASPRILRETFVISCR